MQVFVPYSTPYYVAECLDKRRLNKQVSECRQIIKAITGESDAWKNHPVVKMYEKHLMWLTRYAMCLDAYRKGMYKEANYNSRIALKCTPEFFHAHFHAIIMHHRVRLYQKDPTYYRAFANTYQPSTYNDVICRENVYIVDGKTLWYRDGKMVRTGYLYNNFFGEKTWMDGYANIDFKREH